MEETHSFFPEHDIEDQFDVEVGNEDINVINKIRLVYIKQSGPSPPKHKFRKTYKRPGTIIKGYFHIFKL